MLLPLDVYISLLFLTKQFSKALWAVFLVSLTIVGLQLLLGYVGIVEAEGLMWMICYKIILVVELNILEQK